MEAEPDPTWPMASRGLRLLPDTRLQKARPFSEAVVFGLDRTMGFIKQIYLNLSSLLSGRISAKSLGGPVEIASQAFSMAGEDPFLFALFLGIISINLAVVNFLPIPVLDGGHMVFLIYEKLRGRPPSETVRTVATYVGLAADRRADAVRVLPGLEEKTVAAVLDVTEEEDCHESFAEKR